MQGMGEFLSEMAAMMSQTDSNVSLSYHSHSLSSSIIRIYGPWPVFRVLLPTAIRWSVHHGMLFLLSLFYQVKGKDNTWHESIALVH